MAPFEKINIPQKPPMGMVDRLIELSESLTVTSFLIRDDNIFYENGVFAAPGLIENMAQTAAAGAGARACNSHEKVPIGFIGGIRNLVIEKLPKAGQEIITHATILHRIFDATIVKGEVFLDEDLIASCELKIFITRNA